jgi:hypothetical protein
MEHPLKPDSDTVGAHPRAGMCVASVIRYPGGAPRRAIVPTPGVT